MVSLSTKTSLTRRRTTFCRSAISSVSADWRSRWRNAVRVSARRRNDIWSRPDRGSPAIPPARTARGRVVPASDGAVRRGAGDRKSTRLNSSHVEISYAVFCLKKKKKHYTGSSVHKKKKKKTQTNK